MKQESIRVSHEHPYELNTGHEPRLPDAKYMDAIWILLHNDHVLEVVIVERCIVCGEFYNVHYKLDQIDDDVDMEFNISAED